MAAFAGFELGGQPGQDEVLVVHDAATAGLEEHNDGSKPFTAYLFSGPDLHPEAALLGPGWAR